MSIDALLNQIKNKPDKVQESQSVSTEPIETPPDVPAELSALHSKELLRLMSEVQSWLETHECQTGTNNKLDVNDRPYDSEKYEEKLKELYGLTAAYFSRPLGEELEDK